MTEDREKVESAESEAEMFRREAEALAKTQCTVVTIPAENWDAFEAWLEAPARDIPALRELARATFK